MNRIDYQNLRFAVESEIANLISSPSGDYASTVNSVMRHFLSAMAQQEVKAQRSRRDFKLFKKNHETVVPGWAFHPKRV